MEVNGEPWFVGKDVAIALGYSNSRNAVPAHVDDEDKLCTQIEYAGQKREVTLINESGLYSLVLSSKLPSAKKFKRWITSEVLPAIRKNGGYISGQDDMTPEVHFDHKCALDRHHNKANPPAMGRHITVPSPEMIPKETGCCNIFVSGGCLYYGTNFLVCLPE